METDDEILGISPRTRFSTYDYPPMTKRENVTRNRHTLTFSDLPQRSRSMVNLAHAHHHHLKRHTWLLPESPTVSEKQAQLTKRRSLAGALSPPAPKIPNVGRYLEIFTKLKTAYSGFVKACENVDPSSLSGKDKVIFDKCRRKLTAKLVKIQDLHELYVHQEHMREGAQNLLKTLERESSKKMKSGIDYCSRNLRKNVTRLCAVEDEVDTMSGTMKIEIIGLIGFARLSPGDVYGVQFKHGHEKSNSKCRVVGQGQKWTNTNIKFKITPTHDLLVKVHEVRKINTNNIGTASCPIAGFLSAEGQEFVLPVNSTGTLKLKICATWSPFTNKEENALRGKVPVIASPNIQLDSLSDTISYASSPSSTPRNGTLSSMPNMSANGTLTPMKVSVSGTVFSSHASVSKHSRTENDPARLSATFVEHKDSTWITSVKAQSLPDITKTIDDEVAFRSGNEADTTEQSPSNDKRGRNGSLAHSSDHLNERVILRDEKGTNKKKPRPITLGPTFSTGFSSQSDYENVVNLISASIMGEEPDVIPKDERSNRKKKHRPMSVGPSFPHVPPPDYAPDCSPGTPVTSPTFFENNPMLAITEPYHAPSDENANHPQERSANKSPVTEAKRPAPVISEPDYPSSPVEKTVDLAGQSTVEPENSLQEIELKATTSVSSSTVIIHENKLPITDIGTDALIPVEENIENDRLLAEIRAISLDLLLRLTAVPSDLSSRLESLEAVVNELTNLLKEKKTSLSRTASIENALNSIDNAFDFLADHQTMKPDTLLDEGHKEILPRKWNVFKFVLRHHLKASQNMLKAVKATASPLKVKPVYQLLRMEIGEKS